MANSYVFNTGNGVQTTWAVPFPYLDVSHVHVYLNGVETFSFTWPTTGTIQLSAAPASGVVVLIKRVTPVNAPLTSFTSAAVLTGSALNTSELQALYASAEAQDIAGFTIAKSSVTGQWDAISYRLTNLADPTSAQDAATKNYVDTYAGVAAANAAAASAASASSAASTATTAASNAAASATAAATFNPVLYATLASPTFTGSPRAPTPSVLDNSTLLATTAFTQQEKGYYKSLVGWGSNGTITAAQAGLYHYLSSGTTFTLTFPSPATAGMRIKVMNLSSATSHSLTTPSGVFNFGITNAATVSILPGQSYEWVADGTNWNMVATGRPYGSAAFMVPALNASAQLPAVDGSLLTNITGKLLRTPQLLTTGTSYTTPAGCTQIYVEAIGGGGGGILNFPGSTSAGASGAYTAKLFAVSPSTAYAYTIGAGAATANAASAGSGTATTFTVGGNTMTAGGGTGGALSPAAFSVGGVPSGVYDVGINGTSGGITNNSNIAAMGGTAPMFGGGKYGSGGSCYGTFATVGLPGAIRIWEYS